MLNPWCVYKKMSFILLYVCCIFLFFRSGKKSTVRDRLLVCELVRNEGCVVSLLLQKFCMCASFYDVSLVEHQNEICIAYGTQTVCNEYLSAVELVEIPFN